MPTSTPPPYFPQNPLSPADPKAKLKRRLMMLGCLLVLLILVAGFVVGTIYLIKRLF